MSDQISQPLAATDAELRALTDEALLAQLAHPDYPRWPKRYRIALDLEAGHRDLRQRKDTGAPRA